MRVVLDTNVLVAGSYHPSSASARIVAACLQGQFELLVSPDIQREYQHILPRAVRRAGELEMLRALLAQAVSVVPLQTPRVVPTDPADDMLLAAAVVGAATAVVSSDRAVLELDPYQGIRVLDPTRFCSTFGSQE